MSAAAWWVSIAAFVGGWILSNRLSRSHLNGIVRLAIMNYEEERMRLLREYPDRRPYDMERIH